MKKIDLVWGAGEIPESLKVFKDNYEAFDALMGSLELSGLFSDKLLRKVYTLCWMMLELRIKEYNKGISDIEAAKNASELFDEFKALLNTYCIFSDTFKNSMVVLYLTIAVKR